MRQHCTSHRGAFHARPRPAQHFRLYFPLSKQALYPRRGQMAPLRSLVALAASTSALACSNLLASRGATTDGSTMVGYLADDIGLCAYPPPKRGRWGAQHEENEASASPSPSLTS
jgi:hypothetical protein